MTVIVGTDFSPTSTRAADMAAEIARRRGEELVVAHVVDGPLFPGSRHGSHHEQMDAEAHRLRAHDCQVRAALLRDGPTAARLAEAADTEKASLVVIGAEGTGRRGPLGSVATAVVRTTRLPVLVVRNAGALWQLESPVRPRALLSLALDQTDSALPEVLTLAGAMGDIDVDVVHYQPVAAGRSDGQESTQPPADAAALASHLGGIPVGVAVKSIIERDAYGRLDGHLCNLARERKVDLIIIGSHHRHGVERLIAGSVAEGVVIHAPCSVLVARAPGA